MTVTVSSGVTAGFGASPNPTSGLTPINKNGKFVDSPIRLDTEKDILISSKTIQTPSASLLIGDNVKLTDSGSGVGYTLSANDKTFEISGSEYDATTGSLSALTVVDYPSGAFDLSLQLLVDESLTTNYHQWQAAVTGSGFDLLRVFTVNLKGAAGSQAPVRLRLFHEDPLLNPSAIPFFDNVDKFEWENGREGLDLVDSTTTIVDFGQGQRLREGDPFFIVYDVPDGEQFSILGSTVDIGFGATFVPYQVSSVMGGNELVSISTSGISTDNSVVRFDGTSGSVVQDSGIILDDTDSMSVPGDITLVGALADRLTIGYKTVGDPTDNITEAQIIVDLVGNLRFASRSNDPSALVFYTTALNTAIERFRINSSGQLSAGTINADASAAFDLFSTTRGFLPPRMSTTQRDAITSPASGLVIYNTTDNRLEHYNGTAWTAGAGSGDVSGPASSVDKSIALFSGTSGEVIVDSLLQVTDDATNATLSPTITDGDILIQGNDLGKSKVGIALIPGIDWISRPSLTGSTWTGSTFANGLFVIVSSSNGSQLVATSPDGINWTRRNTPNEGGDFGNWVDVTFGNGTFVAVAQAGSFDKIMTSPDAITTWVRQTPSVIGTWKGITFGNGVFVAVSNNASVMTSPDGINWTTRTGSNQFWRAVTFGNGLFVAVASTGILNRVQTSPDGITWTNRTTIEDNTWSDITFGDNLFVAVSSDGTNRVMTSPDGITWTAQTAAEQNDWRGVDSGDNGLFVAVSFTGTNQVMTSPDGINWTAQSAAAANNWRTVACSEGMFISVAQSGTDRAMSSGTLEKNLLRGGFNVEDGFTIGDAEASVLPSNTVIISQDSEWPLYFESGKDYLITAPITVTAGNESTLANSGNILIESTDRTNNTVTYTGTTGTLLNADAITGSVVFEKINFIGNGSTSRLMNLTASGFPGLTMDKCNINGWGAVSELDSWGGGIAIGKISGSGNASGIFNITNSVFFGVENCFFQNFSDTSSNFFTIDALTSRVAMLLTGVVCQPNENVYLINSSFTGETIVTTEFGTPTGQLFDSAGLDGTSIYVDVNSASNQPDSDTSAELFLTSNTATTDIPEAGALVEINVDVNWTDDSERMTISTDGVATMIGLSTIKLNYSGNINLEPATATKSISVRTVTIVPTEIVVTFTNGTNLINETGTALVDGDNISFRDTEGTLPGEIRADVVYFVISQLTNSFQVAYTSGGSAIVFTDDGSGTNSYKVATLEGATPTNSIGSSSARDLIPQATITMVTGSKGFLAVVNNDDAVDILVNSGYQRYT